jgi:hypothetical protein
VEEMDEIEMEKKREVRYKKQLTPHTATHRQSSGKWCPGDVEILSKSGQE